MAKLLCYQGFKGKPYVRRSTPELPVAALVSFAAILILAVSRLAGAATINANSASESDVAAAIASATDGDTVIIAAGTATWTHTLSVKKAIELRGAGIGNTIIKDGVQKGQTISVALVPGKVTRITGIEFQDGGRPNSTGEAPIGVFRIDGSNTDGSQLRWDHCKFDNLNGFFVPDTVIGVFDHNIVMIGQKGGTPEFMYPYGMRWNGGWYGDGSWAAPAGWGSSQFFFIEDNTFINSNPTYQGYFTDGFGGARIVVRHNTSSGGIFSNHGTESAGRIRSARAFEIYKNNINCNNLNRFPGGSRGGSTLFHDNTITNCGDGVAQFNLDAYRMLNSFTPFGGGDGTNEWDKNNPGNPFYSGTASAVGPNTVSVSGSPWTADQWKGYTVKRNAGGFAYIQTNTSNTITFASGVFDTLSFSVGDGFVINKVEQSIDQPGAGASTLLSGDNPRPPRGWNQVADPCYSWSNTNDGAPFNNFTSNESNIKVKVNFFNDTALPGYREFTYPHPLVNGKALPVPPSPAATRASLRRPWGGKQPKTKELKRKPEKKEKQNPANEMAESQEKLGN
jgi:hypothetical protein